MVSNARLDLPLPLGPVTTVNFPSGRSTSTPLRLFWRAPRISMQSLATGSLRCSVLVIFEPTGNIRCQSSSSQISSAQYARHPKRRRRRLRLVARSIVLLVPHLTQTPFAREGDPDDRCRNFVLRFPEKNDESNRVKCV